MTDGCGSSPTAPPTSYGLYVPAWVMADPGLSLTAKCVYGKVLNLSRQHGYCFASNKVLGHDLGAMGRPHVSADRVQHLLGQLVKRGHLRREGVGKLRRLRPINSTAQLAMRFEDVANPGENNGVYPGENNGATQVKTATDSSRDVTTKDGPSYSPAFETWWTTYPRRAGGNPKRAAWRVYRARLGDGATEAELQAGCERYTQHCKAEGNTGTRYVMRGSTFLGPDEHWKEVYDGSSDPWAKQWALVNDVVGRAQPEGRLGEMPLPAIHALYDVGGIGGLRLMTVRDYGKARARFLGICADEAAAPAEASTSTTTTGPELVV